MKRPMFFAKKTSCAFGHRHDSGAEAKRCELLHVRQAKGDISSVRAHPEFEFLINGVPVKMANGHKMKFTADFEYMEGGSWVVEDVKAKNGFMSRDVPIKLALLRHLYPHITWRIVT